MDGVMGEGDVVAISVCHEFLPSFLWINCEIGEIGGGWMGELCIGNVGFEGLGGGAIEDANKEVLGNIGVCRRIGRVIICSGGITGYVRGGVGEGVRRGGERGGVEVRGLGVLEGKGYIKDGWRCCDGWRG